MRPNRWIDAAALLLWAVAIVWPLERMPVVGDDEAREAGLVRHVATHGMTPFPVFNGEVLPDKPILFHWLAALLPVEPGALQGRLASALAGALFLGALLALLPNLFGLAIARAATVILATSPMFVSQARMARPDVLLTALVTASLLSFWIWHRTNSRRALWASWLLFASTVLTKGPVGPAILAPTVVGFLAWRGELGRLRPFVLGAHLPVAMLLALSWHLAAVAHWGDWFVQDHLLGRYVGNVIGEVQGFAEPTVGSQSLLAHLTFYPMELAAALVPWSLLALAIPVLRRGWGNYPDGGVAILAVWSGVTVAVFSLADFKLPVYIMPMLPASCLLLAPALVEVAGWPGKLSSGALARRLPLAFVGGLVVLAVLFAVAQWLAAAGWLSRSDRSNLEAFAGLVERRPALCAGLAAGGALLGATAVLAFRRGSGLSAIAIVVVVIGLLQHGLYPPFKAAKTQAESLADFMGSVRETAQARPVGILRYKSPALAYAADRVMPTVFPNYPLEAGLVLVRDIDREAFDEHCGQARELLRGSGRVGNLRRTSISLLEHDGCDGVRIAPPRAVEDLR